MEQFDLLIIGGGPSGLNCAIEAGKAGLNYVVIEKGVLVNSLYHFPTNMTFFSTSKLLEIADTPFISHGEKPTRKESLEYYRRLVQRYQINLRLYEEVLEMQAIEGGYTIHTSKGQYRAQSIIIATGFYDTPRSLNVPGENLPKVTHYYTDPHPYVNQDVLVIGAANSACDAALETYYKGARVTMAIRRDSIYKGVKYWIRPNIENRIKEGSIKAYFNTEVVEIKEKEVILQNPEGVFSIANDFVLAMTGYQPNYPLMERLGIQCHKDADKIPIHDVEQLETHLPNVYLAGVLCAGMKTSKLFIENTRNHGEIIVNQIIERRAAFH